MSAKTRKMSGGGKKAAKKPRVVYFDVLRAIAPVFVVFIHAAVTFDTHNTQTHFLQEFGRWAVPIFFMISGALLLDPKKEIGIKKLWAKNIRRILVALLAWSIIYAILFTFFGNQEGSKAYLLGQNIVGGAYHMWFLFSLLAIYIVLPFLRRITADRGLFGYALWVGLIACFALPFLDTIIVLIAHLTNNPFLSGYIAGGTIFSRISTELRLFSLASYFLFGYFLATEDFSKKMRFCIYGLGVVSAVVDLVWVFVGECALGITTTANYYFLPVLLMSGALFLAVRYALVRVKKTPKIIGFMAKHSFGVYLCHLAILIFVVDKWNIIGNSLPMMLLGTSITYLISLAISWILSKIPILKKVV